MVIIIYILDIYECKKYGYSYKTAVAILLYIGPEVAGLAIAHIFKFKKAPKFFLKIFFFCKNI